ncbi:autotransporter domain-containing protein [Microbulbifer harenosus]|uniref:Autotransporter outer membrane beta-barrel domain-containing protein n=1 Tax=Microbulbifer harenosus TaxID=2576840 RepID=A0ABY2UJG4_9GAMM|nr:autotransporter domain-containing protein [Microbulbifer harenosus]TLM77066.1 autotransporter outer membrane beta-barrel domain-containing protein [Microbulbifer harenosus]
MNHNYRITFNHSLRLFQVVSELATASRAGSGSATPGEKAAARSPRRGLRSLALTLALAATPAGAVQIIDGASVEIVDGSGDGTTGTQDSPWNLEGALFIGRQAGDDAGLVIRNGGKVSNLWGTIGVDTGSSGMVTVTGEGSDWANNGSLSVGNRGTGTLSIEDGGMVSNTDGYIGYDAGSSGTVTVTGEGSGWTNSSALHVGINGTGTLNIEDGGSVSNTAGYIGANHGSTGRVTVTGKGSGWTNSNWLYVGINGSGTLNIENGGTVSNSSSYIGRFSSSTGTVTVTGAGSGWTNSGWIIVGIDGSGMLNIEDGGKVSGAALAMGDADGSSGALLLSGTETGRGVLETGFVQKRDGGASFTFDGGILRATANQADFLPSFAAGDVTIAAGGAYIDSNGFDIGIATDLQGSGSLTKLGAGTLTLAGANSYTGSTTIEAGTLLAGASTALVQNTAFTINGGTLDLNGYDHVMSSLSGGGGTLAIGGAGLTVDQTGDTAYAGALTGVGSFQKTGSGTLEFSGDSSGFTGATLVEQGLLAVNGILGGDLTVQNGATLGGSGTVGSTTMEEGGILAPGNSTGTLTVDGDLTLAQGSILDFEFGAPGADFNTPGDSDSVTVSGDLALEGTILDITDTGGFGPGLYRLFDYDGSLTLSNGGLLLDDAQDETVLAFQYLSNETSGGQINLLNTSGMVLNFWNANGQAGESQLGGGNGTWSASAEVWADAHGILTGAMRSQPGFAIFGGEAGTVTLDTSDGEVTATGLQFASDGYRLTGGTLTLSVDSEIRVGDGGVGSETWTATIDSAVAGSEGLRKTGAGTLTLSGNSAGFAGNTTIAAGLLMVNGSLGGSLTVQDAAVLGGSGTVGSTQLQSGGILAPGNTIGTLTVYGDLTFGNGSVYLADVDADGNGDQIHVSGRTTLGNGSAVHVVASGDFEPFTDYTILVADGGIDGQFGAVTTNYAFLAPQLSYDASHVYLELTRNDLPFGDLARTRNQRATADGIETLGRQHPVYQRVVTLDADSAPTAFEALSGDSLLAGINASRELQRRFSAELRRQSSPMGALAVGPAPGEHGEGPAAWVQVESTRFEEDGQLITGNASYRMSGQLLAAGADARWNEQWLLGTALATADADLDYRNRDAEGELSARYLGLYARWDSDGPLYLRGDLSYADGDTDYRRQVDADRLSASDSVRGTRLALEAGLDLHWAGLDLRPYAQAASEHLKRNGFTEKGTSSAELTVEGNSQSSGEATLGLDLSRAFLANGTWVQVQAGLAAVRGFGDISAEQDARFAGGDTFTLYSADVDATQLDTSLSAEMHISRRLSLWAGYRGRFGGDSEVHGGQLGAQYRW